MESCVSLLTAARIWPLLLNLILGLFAWRLGGLGFREAHKVQRRLYVDEDGVASKDGQCVLLHVLRRTLRVESLITGLVLVTPKSGLRFRKASRALQCLQFVMRPRFVSVVKLLTEICSDFGRAAESRARW